MTAFDEEIYKSASALVEMLTERRMSVATAESCTGGTLAGAITDVAGSSAVFGYGIVSYANEAKMKLLGVKEETLCSHGAVSREVACEMAKGVRERSGADFGLSTTGIAGPGGAVPGKPVGTVWCAIASKDSVEAYLLNLSGGRADVRAQTVEFLLKELICKIQDK